MKYSNKISCVGILAAVLAGACRDDAATLVTTPSELGPVYAMMTQVYDVDDRTVYISLSDIIDMTELSLDGAREFGGVANFAAVAGRLLVSDGYEPLITEFEIDAGLRWVEGISTLSSSSMTRPLTSPSRARSVSCGTPARWKSAA